MGRTPLELEPWDGWWRAAEQAETWRKTLRLSWLECGQRLRASRETVRRWVLLRRQMLAEGRVPACLQPENRNRAESCENVQNTGI